MAQNVTVAGASYENVPAVNLPKTGGGTATFYDSASLPDFTGADGSNAGARGFVPAPAATDNTKYLKGNGTWSAAPVTSVNNQTGAVSLTIPTITNTTATLSSSNWNSTSHTQSVTVSGVTTSNTVIVSPAPSDIATWVAGNVRCTSQTTNSLTFTCDTNPTANITANVVIL